MKSNDKNSKVDEYDIEVITKLVNDAKDLFDEHKNDYKIREDRIKVLYEVIGQLYKDFEIDKLNYSLVGYGMKIDSDGNIEFTKDNENKISRIHKIYWFDEKLPTCECLNKLTIYINNHGIKGECEIIESSSVEYAILDNHSLALVFPTNRIEEAIANMSRADFVFIVGNGKLFNVTKVN